MAHHSLSALGEQIACVRALTRDLLAAGTGDNSEVDGEDIDRFVNGTNASGGIFGSVVFAVTARAVLTDKKTLVVKATLQDSADGTTFADVAAALQPAPARALGRCRPGRQQHPAAG